VPEKRRELKKRYLRKGFMPLYTADRSLKIRTEMENFPLDLEK
jgi:hypothetical protein